jgi:hypothetical protein
VVAFNLVEGWAFGKYRECDYEGGRFTTAGTRAFSKRISSLDFKIQRRRQPPSQAAGTLHGITLECQQDVGKAIDGARLRSTTIALGRSEGIAQSATSILLMSSRSAAIKWARALATRSGIGAVCVFVK